MLSVLHAEESVVETQCFFFGGMGQVWNTHNWTCHKEVLGHGDEIWALAVIGDRLISGSIDRYEL